MYPGKKLQSCHKKCHLKSSFSDEISKCTIGTTKYRELSLNCQKKAHETKLLSPIQIFRHAVHDLFSMKLPDSPKKPKRLRERSLKHEWACHSVSEASLELTSLSCLCLLRSLHSYMNSNSHPIQHWHRQEGSWENAGFIFMLSELGEHEFFWRGTSSHISRTRLPARYFATWQTCRQKVRQNEARPSTLKTTRQRISTQCNPDGLETYW